MTDDKQETKPKEETALIVHEFTCYSCKLSEKAHYKGNAPPFSRNIVLKCPSYVIKDPFSPPGMGEILILGADCALCEKQVCINKECSFFYLKMYCLDCCLKSVDNFPVEIRNKLKQVKKEK